MNHLGRRFILRVREMQWNDVLKPCNWWLSWESQNGSETIPCGCLEGNPQVHSVSPSLPISHRSQVIPCVKGAAPYGRRKGLVRVRHVSHQSITLTSCFGGSPLVLGESSLRIPVNSARSLLTKVQMVLLALKAVFWAWYETPNFTRKGPGLCFYAQCFQFQQKQFRFLASRL